MYPSMTNVVPGYYPGMTNITRFDTRAYTSEYVYLQHTLVKWVNVLR